MAQKQTTINGKTFRVIKIIGDGNCYYRCLARFLEEINYDEKPSYEDCRKKIVSHVHDNFANFQVDALDKDGKIFEDSGTYLYHTGLDGANCSTWTGISVKMVLFEGPGSGGHFDLVDPADLPDLANPKHDRMECIVHGRKANENAESSSDRTIDGNIINCSPYSIKADLFTEDLNVVIHIATVADAYDPV